MTTFIITLGIPRSTRSEHADDLFGRLTEKHNKEVGYVSDVRGNSLEASLKDEFITYGTIRKYDYIIFDVDAVTIEEVEEIKEIIERNADKYEYTPNYEIHLFRPNLERAKIYNFLHHREVRDGLAEAHNRWNLETNELVELFGNIVIEHLELPEPTRGHRAVYKAGLKDWNIDPYSIDSENWSGGGWDRTWWLEDEYNSYEVEEAPEEFKELKEFLKAYLGDKYTEDIYRELFVKATIEESHYEEDWYADITYRNYTIKMDTVLEYLIKNDIIEEEE